MRPRPPVDPGEGLVSVWQSGLESLPAVLALAAPWLWTSRTYHPDSPAVAALQLGVLALAACWLGRGLELGRWSPPRAAARPLAPVLVLAAWTAARLLKDPHPLAFLPRAADELILAATYALAVLGLGGARSQSRLARAVAAAAAASFLASLEAWSVDGVLQSALLGAGLPLLLSRAIDPGTPPAGLIVDAVLAVFMVGALVDGRGGALETGMPGLIFALAAPAFVPGRRARLAALLAAAAGVWSLVAAPARPPAAGGGGHPVALILTLAALLPAWRAGRAFKAQGALAEGAHAAGLLAAAAGQALASWLSGGAESLAASWLGCLLAGSLAGLSLLGRRGEAEEDAPCAAAPARGLYLPLAAAIAALGVVPAAWLESDRQLQHAASAAADGRWREALARCDKVRLGARGHAMAQSLAGDALLELGRPWEAAARYQAAEDLAGADAGLNLRKGRAFAAAKDWAKALESFERAARQGPYRVETLSLLAGAAMEVRDLDRARRAALAAVRLDPDDPEAWRTLGALRLLERRSSGRRGRGLEAGRRGNPGPRG